MSTFWVTFYSYKGGVGRTMALANVAASLAQEGRRVLLIDFDIEAPGLDAFKDFGCSKGNPGVVEYVAEYLNTGKAPLVEDFISECVPEEIRLRGKLWMMASGKKNPQYNRDRARINWSELYDKFDGEKFIDNWKADIEQKYSPDYVFLDSRTGLTDVGGVCTLHFPQLVVMLYALNDQNIQGIAGVARAISQAQSKNHPQLLTVASPVPPMIKERKGILTERLRLAESELGVSPHCQIHYEPRVSLVEEIIVWQGNQSRLEWEYRELKEKITDFDPRGLDFLIKESQRAIKELDKVGAYAIKSDLENYYSDRAECFYEIANICRAFGPVEEVETALKISLNLDPFFAPAFEDLVKLLRSNDKITEAIQICKIRLSDLMDCIEVEEVDSTLFTLGELCMADGLYIEASNAYGDLLERVKLESDAEVYSELACVFNFAESRRRAGIHVPLSDWKKIIDIYEKGAISVGSGPSELRLNRMQAMHIPYFIVGDGERASQLLLGVNELAQSVSPRERVFSVLSYKSENRDEFLRHNVLMLEAIGLGKLWDGSGTS